MKIKRLHFQKLNIPFKAAFQHASATRLETETVLASAESESGHSGYGEGCPRQYVTGESYDTCFQFFDNWKNDLKKLTDIDSIKNWAQENEKVINKNPAAWCALEMALLDLISREEGCTVEALLSLPELSGTFQYTAVLGINSPTAFKKQLTQYGSIGFRDYKLKVTGDIEKDKIRLHMMAEALPAKSTIRLDANNVWTKAQDAVDFLHQLDQPIAAIEEPISKNDFQGHVFIHKQLGYPVILDESFCDASQFDELMSSPQSFIINLRISKMGGLLRSLNILEEAQRRNIPIIIGAQVGESSLLTRAALTLANAFPGLIERQEGAFGTHLLKNDITDSPLMFGSGGVLTITEAMNKPGLGVDVNPGLL